LQVSEGWLLLLFTCSNYQRHLDVTSERTYSCHMSVSDATDGSAPARLCRTSLFKFLSYCQHGGPSMYFFNFYCYFTSFL